MRAGRLLPSLLALAVTVLAVLGALAAYRRGFTAGKVGGDHGDSERQVAQAHEMFLMKARLRALERRNELREEGDGATDPAARSAAAAAALAASGGPAAASSPPRARPAGEEDTRRYFSALESRLAAEPRDADWARPVEDKLRQSGHGFGAKITVEAARCGRAMCRMDVKRELGPASNETVRDFLRQAVAVLPEAVIQKTEDPARFVVYLVRDGETLPPLVGAEPPR